MEPRLLRAFVAVAEELHFGRAARRLHISQPPLSTQIRKLEQELQASLFDRTNRRVALTPAGEALLGRARHILAESERAALEVKRAASGESGVLTLAYTATAAHEVLPQLLPRFLALHPQLRLELLEMRSASQPEAICAGRAELGLVCAPLETPVQLQLQAQDLIVRRLVRERLVVALPSGHPLARRAVVRACELDGQPYVGVRPDIEPGWAHAALRALRSAGAVPALVQETDTKLALLGLVAAGLGLSVVTDSMMQLGRSGVVFRPLSGLRLQLALSLLSPVNPTPRAAAFMRLARRVYRTRPAAVSPR